MTTLPALATTTPWTPGTPPPSGPHQVAPETPATSLAPSPAAPTPHPPGPGRSWPSPVTAARVTAGWLLILGAALATVLYLVTPILTSGQQQARTRAFALDMQEAVGAASNSFYAAPVATRPDPGQTVAILQVPRLGLQEAVVEGADPEATRNGPGHVSGTAGLGQPGNAVVVGRRGMFGGPFAVLPSVHVGDEIVANTTQGRTLYRVTSVASAAVGESTFGPSTKDRLTLLTAGSRRPWETTSAVVVTADLVGAPFTPTPQNGRLPSGDGHQGDPDAWALVALLLMAFAATAILGTLLGRRAGRLTGFLVATPVLFGVTYLLALAVSRTLPGWI